MYRLSPDDSQTDWRLTTFGGIFGSGHFNISPERLLAAASAGVYAQLRVSR
jgi:hypothetical protein